MNPPQSSKRSPIHLLAATLACAAIALFVTGFRGLRRDAYWFDVTLGDLTRAYEAIPAEQLFQFSIPADTPIVYADWLSAVFFSHLHQWGGAGLSMLAVNLSIALAIAFLSIPALRRGHSSIHIALLSTFAALAAIALTDIQPLSLLALPLALFLLLLHHLHLHPHRWWLALLLPLATAALVNLDAHLTLILTLISLIACASQGATRAFKTALITASTPLGLLAFAYGPLALPDAWSLTALIAPLLLTLTFIALLLIPHLLERRTPPSHPGAPWFVWLPILIALSALAVLVQPGTDTRPQIVPHLVGDLRAQPPLQSLASPDLPFRCAEELRRTGRTLRLYHLPDHAGFLLYHTFRPHRPQAPLFDDHRSLHIDDLQDFHDLLIDQRGGRGLFAAHDINAALLHPDLHGPLIQELLDAPDWYDLRPQDVALRCFIQIDPP